MNEVKTIPARSSGTPEEREKRFQRIARFEKEDCTSFCQHSPLNVKDIYEAFAENFASAEETYFEKRVDVIGVVTRVGPDIHAKPSLELSDQEGGRRYALIVFPDDAIYRQASVGDTVVCRGNLLGAMEPWGAVIKKSEVIEIMPKAQEKLRGKRPAPPEEFQERMKRIAHFEQADCDALEQNEPLNPADVYGDFLEDYDWAEKVYFEKRATMKGIISRIGPDVHGKPSIELTDRSSGRCYALFVFADDSFKGSVSVGDEVVLRGNLLNAREPFGMTMKKCEIVEVK